MNEPKVNPTVDTKPNEVPIVPDDWAALGAKSGYDPKPAEALRLLVVGPSGEGKTTWVGSIPGNLILDFEGGADGLPSARATRIKVKDYNHLMAILDKLKSDYKTGKQRYRRVTPDTVDELVAMIKHQLESEKNVDDITEYRSTGYGYNLINQRLWGLILDLEQHGYTWAFVGHLTSKQETDPSTHKEVTRIKEQVYPKTAAKLKSQCDFKVTIYNLNESVELKRTQKLPGGQTIEVPAGTEMHKNYYLNTVSVGGGDNKARGVPGMPGKIKVPLVGGWDVFKKEYDTAVETARQQYK